MDLQQRGPSEKMLPTRHSSCYWVMDLRGSWPFLCGKKRYSGETQKIKRRWSAKAVRESGVLNPACSVLDVWFSQNVIMVQLNEVVCHRTVGSTGFSQICFGFDCKYFAALSASVCRRVCMSIFVVGVACTKPVLCAPVHMQVCTLWLMFLTLAYMLVNTLSTGCAHALVYVHFVYQRWELGVKGLKWFIQGTCCWHRELFLTEEKTEMLFHVFSICAGSWRVCVCACVYAHKQTHTTRGVLGVIPNVRTGHLKRV